MAVKPNRSWAKTYVQGWNLAMTDPINRFNKSGNGSGNHFPGQGTSTGQQSWKDNCCWRYNRNKCKKTASDWDWDHRCTYCGGWNHSFVNCRKCQKKEAGGRGSDDFRGGSPKHRQKRKHKSN